MSKTHQMFACIAKITRYLLESIGSILFPRVCVGCGAYLEQDDILCEACWRSLPRTEQAALRENLTEELFTEKSKHFVRGAAYLFYDKHETMQRLIHRMKYRNRPEIGYKLGTEAAKEMMESGFFSDVDVLMPVPLHACRFRSRGYNQSEWIARGVSHVTGIPIDTTSVLRVRDNKQQALAGKQDREQNVKDAFKVIYPDEIAGKHILLIDDVVTTGATLRACMDSMKRVRGVHFSVFALGKAR